MDERRAQHVRVGEQYFLLVREVPEEGSGCDASMLGDLDGARVLETLLFEQLHGGLLESFFGSLLPPWHVRHHTAMMSRRDIGAIVDVTP